MVSALISRTVILFGGLLYPAYRSFKAVRNKDVREYVKWMMYWIVFAVFCCVETFADLFLAMFVPFYYEIKMLFVLWLLTPYTKGASIIYRRVIHPFLVRNEKEIDDRLDRFLETIKTEGTQTLMRYGSKGILYAREVVTTAAVKGQEHFVQQIGRSSSMNDIHEETDGHVEHENYQRRESAGERGASLNRGRVQIELIEEEEDMDNNEDPRIWSGYYDDDGEFVEEEEYALLEDQQVVPPPRRTTRQTNKRKTHHDEIGAYTTLPRSTAKPKARPSIKTDKK